MTTVSNSASRHLAPLLLVSGAVLAAANWYLAPERIRSWMIALATLAAMGAVLWAVRGAATTEVRRAADSIRAGVVAGGLILAVSLGVRLAQAVGALDDVEIARRLSMVILGVFLMFTGNAIPKTLTPLSAMSCDAAKVQAAQRFTGWALVLAGAGFAAAWAVLPLSLATPVSITLFVVAALAVLAHAVRLRRVSRQA